MKILKNVKSSWFLTLLLFGCLLERAAWGQEGVITITNESPDKCQIFSVYPVPFVSSFKYCTERRNVRVGARPEPVVVNKIDGAHGQGSPCTYVVEEGYNFIPTNIARVPADSKVKCFFHDVCKCYQE